MTLEGLTIPHQPPAADFGGGSAACGCWAGEPLVSPQPLLRRSEGLRSDVRPVRRKLLTQLDRSTDRGQIHAMQGEQPRLHALLHPNEL